MPSPRLRLPRPGTAITLAGLLSLAGLLLIACGPGAEAPPPPIVSSAVADSPASATDETIADGWDVLLGRHVRDCTIEGIATTAIDYAAIRDDADFDALVAALARATEPSDRSARLAFFINAYNILAVRTVTEAYPVASIRDIGSLLTSVWKREAGVVAGTARSLDDLEHGILRTMGEPRIHAAVNCASLSCPNLRRRAYRADRLDAQLDDAMRQWLSSTTKGARISDDGRTLHVSKIFDWFGSDFTHDGAPLLESISPWLPEELRARIDADKVRVRFLDYDWSLNDAARCGG
jgi:hypothetical protein